jgi:hypothetical protein
MEPGKIICWNVRGLNSSDRQNSVRNLVLSSKADVVCLQETKMTVISTRTILAALGSDFCQFSFLPSSGARLLVVASWLPGSATWELLG